MSKVLETFARQDRKLELGVYSLEGTESRSLEARAESVHDYVGGRHHGPFDYTRMIEIDELRIRSPDCSQYG